VLTTPEQHQPYIITTDASDYAVGAVLSQVQNGVERVIAYESKKLPDTEVKRPPHEKELYAVIHALRTWKHLLLNGQEHQLLTDNSAVSHFKQNYRLHSPKHARWYQEMEEVHLKLAHTPGRTNVVADALSRRPDLRLASVSMIEPGALHEAIRSVAGDDTEYTTLLEDAKAGKPNLKFEVGGDDGLLYFKESPESDARLYVRTGQ
jgi:hypothetical protein